MKHTANVKEHTVDEGIISDEADAAAVASDLSGWTPHASERRDFWNRIHMFPREVFRWRKRLLRELAETPGCLQLAPSLSADQLQDRLDAGISYLREVARILAVLYGTPDLGNKPDPVDELVYIILSRKTREGAYQHGFELLKQRFATWDDLLDCPRRDVERVVFSGGLSTKKTASLYGALEKLRETFGACTLEPARDWPDDRLEDFLCGLPEIQRKSAYCIMMYSFGRRVFPADTHVGRVLSRLGPYRELGLSLDGLDHKKLQRVLADLIPPNLRYSLHVNLVEHGRAVCRSVRPLCGQCELRNFCRYYRRAESMRAAEVNAPVVLDLFTGGGRLSEGFARAGFRILAAVEIDEMAARTYRLNHPGVPEDRVLVQDIRSLSAGALRRLAGRRIIDVLAGFPTCQGFSTAGFRSKKTLTGYRPEQDDRNFLVKATVEAALQLRPRLFLMENVPGIQTVRGANLSFLEEAARILSERGGYRTDIWQLNAAAFGVPQDRVRCFLVASRLREIAVRAVKRWQR
jgi:endonuclease III